MTKRKMTAAELKMAVKLKSIYEARRDAEGITQESVAADLGYSQPTVNQYFNGVIPLNTDAIFAFAEVLGCAPDEINPELGVVLRAMSAKLKETLLPILGALSGEAPSKRKVKIKNVSIPMHCYAVEVDTDVGGEELPRGSVLIINPLGVIKEGRKAIIRKRNEEAFTIAIINKLMKTKVKTTCPFTRAQESVDLEDIQYIHSIHGEQYPVF